LAKEACQAPEVDPVKMETTAHLENLESASGRFKDPLPRRFLFHQGKLFYVKVVSVAEFVARWFADLRVQESNLEEEICKFSTVLESPSFW
jgi:hypothetical protein